MSRKQINVPMKRDLYDAMQAIALRRNRKLADVGRIAFSQFVARHQLPAQVSNEHEQSEESKCTTSTAT